MYRALSAPLARVTHRLSARVREEFATSEGRLLCRSFLLAVVLPVLLAMVFRRANTYLWSLISWMVFIVRSEEKAGRR